MSTNFDTLREHVLDVKGFFDSNTNTISYVVTDPHTRAAAVIDSVLDYVPESGLLHTRSADEIVAYVRAHDLTVEWILETHVHADHVTAAHYLKERLGGKVGISRHIVEVQKTFAPVFGETEEFREDRSQFDVLFDDDAPFALGSLPAQALYVPGHTPADLAYVIGDAVFAGDTIFMPDYGSARCDFPGGSPHTLHESTRKLFALPDSLRMFMCHDYLPEGRSEFVYETTIGVQKRENIHLNESVSREEFVEMRTRRDSTLSMPRLIIPSLQINMRAGGLPRDESGQIFLKIPVNSVFAGKGD